MEESTSTDQVSQSSTSGADDQATASVESCEESRQKEQDYGEVSFFVDELHKGLQSENASEEDKAGAQSITDFTNDFKDLCKKSGITAVQAKAVAEFIKQSGKQAVTDNNLKLAKKAAAKEELYKDYASKNIGTDEAIAGVHKYARAFFKERNLEDAFASEMENPLFLHAMSEVRKTLVTKSEVDRALVKPMILDKYKVAVELKNALTNKNVAQYKVLKATILSNTG